MADFKPVHIVVMTIFASLLSCTESTEDIRLVDAPPIKKFNLETDVYNFAEELEVGDTLRIIADLSLCTSWHIERNLLYKSREHVMIESSQQGEFVSEDEMNLRPVQYTSGNQDTLTFESLLKGLSEESLENGKGSILMVIHGRDTMRFGRTGLIESMRTADYYRQIKRRLYPESDLYDEIVVPEED